VFTVSIVPQVALCAQKMYWLLRQWIINGVAIRVQCGIAAKIQCLSGIGDARLPCLCSLPKPTW